MSQRIDLHHVKHRFNVSLAEEHVNAAEFLQELVNLREGTLSFTCNSHLTSSELSENRVTCSEKSTYSSGTFVTMMLIL
jgi:hypothetical protein